MHELDDKLLLLFFFNFPPGTSFEQTESPRPSDDPPMPNSNTFRQWFKKRGILKGFAF